MNQKEYIVEGRQFRTESDYARALRDRRIIEELRKSTDFNDIVALEKLRKELENGNYSFMTMLGEDFKDEVNEAILTAKSASGKRNKPGKAGKRSMSGKAGKRNVPVSAELDEYVKDELKRREKRRKLTIVLCSVGAVFCLGYFGVYLWFNQRTDDTYRELSRLREQPVRAEVTPEPLFTLDEQPEPKEVLDEYKNLLNKNKKLIGWLKIDDTNIDYPVMQTTDNVYYLEHNLNQEYDKNGSIFMDKDCNVLKPSTNYIIYGHHMKSGNMFGKLDLYEDEDYCREHPYIQFDTIYEKGTYEVMYVFRSRVYSEEEIVFKYYQFIDANSEQEFNSYMSEMESMSLYDTGVRAEYGDQLLTLSTCDYQEKNGRFVVVAKKIKE
ncbi:MAG: class B sortase [Lachnospiraceae bacterium]|nr:class B sortase [Lachnospiraceae bacterium]